MMRRKLSIYLNRVCVAWIVIIYLRCVCCMVLTSAWQRDRCNLWCSSIIDDFVSLSFFFLIHGSFALIFISFLIFELLNLWPIIIGVVIIFRWSNVLSFIYKFIRICSSKQVLYQCDYYMGPNINVTAWVCCRWGLQESSTPMDPECASMMVVWSAILLPR